MDGEVNIDFSNKMVEMKNIVKKYGDFVANDDISIKVHKGEIHALLGENGAGKSTLMNILYGLHQPTSGEIYINGEKIQENSPALSIEKGIGMVHQHFMLIPNFTVSENIILGMEPVRKWNQLDINKAKNDVSEISNKYGLRVDPNYKVQDISVGMQQRVEILKALYRGAEILILDEPTAVLTPQEINELIIIMKNLTKQGKSIILITHKLKEIKDAADFCTIIRKGKMIDTVNVKKVTSDELASKMVGREVSFEVEKKLQAPGNSVLKVSKLSAMNNRGIPALRELDLEVRSGEILGIAGIEGNGQSELVEVLTGLRKALSGSIKINGEEILNEIPKKIMKSGVSNIPEDRQRRGLVLDFSIAENIVLQNYEREPFSKTFVLNEQAIKSFSKELIKKFDIRPTNENIKVKALSGGNQQKVIIAREVTNDPDLLIATQPTRGLDVGAIEYVHKSLVNQRDKGKAVLLISLELDEIMSISDRIAVIYEGKIVDILDIAEANEDKLGLLMAGGKK
ncbi:ABC transporter ATP-binding protein [Serpentinicella sp. ANB-PHB4]|uniref:ABC transporter ATP-binding protein n=1 Tax=Serpentinicella sp. ANB-PHB4 TaxID=3074076 RepID=UPI00285D7651|nr:ABC transporter ATP-binding protein [Serpentinicella sp. ANB-PHB4]MDR5658977.1 ABC transporter ATP-binding protein [Serpentinicella sp. ANB-PHB4]